MRSFISYEKILYWNKLALASSNNFFFFEKKEYN